MTIVPADIEDIARAVAARRGVTMEDVLRHAVETEARLAGIVGVVASKPANLPRAREIARRVARLPLCDARPPKEILDEAWDVPDDSGR